MIYGDQEFAERLQAIIKDDYRHALYEQTVSHCKEMRVHIYGDKPMVLLDRARPREDDDVKTYRLENYEPTTKAGADKAIDIVGKIFNPSLYSINFKEQNEESKELQDYTLEYYPNYNSLTSFDKEVLLRKMLADPNAVLAIKPEDMPEDDTERLKPVSVIYGSVNIYDYEKNYFLIFDEKEVVDGQEYQYFYYYDKTDYIEFKAWFVPANGSLFTTELSRYTHGFKEVPAWFLRGKSKCLDNGEILYESFFSSALPYWNQVVIHESDLLGAYINHLHPQKYELAEECNFKYPYEGQSYPCRGGVVKYPGRDGQATMDCPHCLGTGYSSVKSPFGTYQFSRSKLEEGTPSGLMPVGYITIPVEATKMLEVRCDALKDKAMWSINMDVEDKVGENQSGIAKVIDRSAQMDTLATISGVIYDIHLTNQYYFTNKYMFSIEASSANKKEDKNLPEINKPTQFDVLTTSELINNFAIASKSGVDKNYLRLKAIEIANRDLSTSPDVRLYLVTTLNLDPLYGFTQDEISLGVTSGVIRKNDWSIHENLKPFMDRAIKEKNDFLKLEKDQQLVILNKYADELIKAEKPAIDVNMFAPQQQMNNVA